MRQVDILGCHVTPMTRTELVSTLIERVRVKLGGYVCFANVHLIVKEHNDDTTLNALNCSFLTVTDGRPIYWLARIESDGECEQIPGPEFMPLMLEAGIKYDLKHFLLGGTPLVLNKLKDRLLERWNDLSIVGVESPPFRDMTAAEIEALLGRIRDSKANIVWVGLGAPKQEIWMKQYAAALKPAILMGVGAAFDINADAKKRAPRVMSRMGIEWLYRLCQEPGRLWKRYLVTNVLFMFLLIKRLLVGKR